MELHLLFFILLLVVLAWVLVDVFLALLNGLEVRQGKAVCQLLVVGLRGADTKTGQALGEDVSCVLGVVALASLVLEDDVGNLS